MQTSSILPGPRDALSSGFDPADIWANIGSWIETHSRQFPNALLVGLGVVAALFALRLFGSWLRRPRERGGVWPKIIGETLALTRFWFMLALALRIMSRLTRAPSEIALPIHIIFVAALGIQLALWCRSLILGIIQARAKEKDPGNSIDSALGIIRLLVTVGLFALAIILILANLGVNVSGLLAGLGIGGIAIGLAAQGIFSDLFAALSILFDRPFRKGDLIRWDQTNGTVESIGLKTSRIRALSGEQVIISNANLLGKEVRNFERIKTRRINQVLALVFNTPLDKCEALSAILEPAVNACAGCKFVRCGLENFGTSSLDFSLVYDVRAGDQTDILVQRNAANLAVLKALAENGIAFAYPTQTTYTAGPDGTLVMPWAPPPKK